MKSVCRQPASQPVCQRLLIYGPPFFPKHKPPGTFRQMFTPLFCIDECVPALGRCIFYGAGKFMANAEKTPCPHAIYTIQFGKKIIISNYTHTIHTHTHTEENCNLKCRNKILSQNKKPPIGAAELFFNRLLHQRRGVFMCVCFLVLFHSSDPHTNSSKTLNKCEKGGKTQRNKSTSQEL